MILGLGSKSLASCILGGRTDMALVSTGGNKCRDYGARYDLIPDDDDG